MADEKSAAGHWSWTVDGDGIGWLGADRAGASTNTLSRAVLEDLNAQLERIERDCPRGLVIWSAKRNGFVAGADISEFTAIQTAEQGYALVRAGQQVMDRIERLPCPTVAALHGFALGGGLELALACRYRVAADDDKVSLGLPEVQLGIHPGFGGTVRAPRLIGGRAALDLMLTGRPVRARRALALGLVDRLAPPDGLKAAAAALLKAPPAPRRAPLLDRLLALGALRGSVASQARAQVARRARPEHYPAPYAIIELWRRYGAAGAEAYEAEARSFATVCLTEASRSLVRVFFLQDRLKGLAGKDAAPAQAVHVVGAGVMGGDIAAWCAQRGLSVTLQDRSLELVEPALARARAGFGKRAKTPAAAAEMAARLAADVEGRGATGADVVIEAIYENAAAKQALYGTLEPRLKAGALLATNTSSLMLETLAATLANPARLVGLHFFNPVAKMPLVEVIHAERTDPAAIKAALAFARRIDKLPLPCRSAPGFVVNRILFPYLTEAMLAAQDGIALPVLDEAALGFGMPQGPIELADTVGLDVALHVGEVLSAAFGTPRPAVLEPLVAARKLGRKSGEGFYVWRDGKPVKPSATGPVPEDLADRLILPMLNEAAACLRQGIVADEDLLDAGVIFGTGFAPFRGGPLHYARHRGIGAIVARLEELAARYGARFKPDAHWAALER
ncbi:MAG TPA: 3-hydroxyacyl-CoA dehydrogenase NAD-binding domain-containing protein [Steroidobacteraceae bacterium]|nr:3-hydroxyacyl-CoA dehydrogenase NAD-binding domain-containing protein [Steroidobacteraceae bacterium]